MKNFIAGVFVVSLFWIAACSAGSEPTQSNAQTASPATRTDYVPAATPSRASNTAAPVSLTLTPTQLSSPLQVVTQTPMWTLTPTPGVTAPLPGSTIEPFHNRLLPDLQTLPPSDLRLLYDAQTGRGVIRFTNSIWTLCPVSTANPDRSIVEADYANNTGLIFFEIRNLRLEFIGAHLNKRDDVGLPKTDPKP